MRVVSIIPIVLLSLLTGALALAQVEGPTTPTDSETSDASATPDATITPLAASMGTPVGAPNTVMLLYEIAVPPDAEIEDHTHYGASVWYIESGSLGYTVTDGEVWAYCDQGCPLAATPAASTSPSVAEPLRPNVEVTLNAGDWVVQYDDVGHSYRTVGETPVVIVVSTVIDPTVLIAIRCGGGCK